MKKSFVVALLVIIAGLAKSHAQSNSTEFRARNGARGDNVDRRPPPEPVRRGQIGAFTRAARGGDPLQMLNPNAPRKYFGPPQDTVTVEPNFARERYSGNQVTGIILFGIVW